MPVPLRTPYSKAEAKYNVITEFPKLGLHEAAASGNLGLVEYALDHGQPINSVLDGVLPLHAACAGGHIQVVKLLIEHGADVNAPRLPRRYFNDKNRDASAPIVGTSGSTPLHFAAANGNTEVVTLLLLHGAHADRADKYGVTPEMLARDNNWMECAQVLREWVINKDRDLREREELLGDGAGAASSANVSHEHSMEPESPSFRRRLLVKRSDTALNILKASASQSDRRLNPTLTSVSPPSSPLKTFGQYSFNPDANGSSSLSQSRRPSLPQIHPPPPPETARRKPQTPSPIQRRPRSAGNGADRSPDQEVYLPYGRGGSGRKLTNKISLLFKKGLQGEPSESQTTTHSAPTPASVSATTLPLSSTPSSKGRPHASSVDTSPHDHTPSKQRNHAPSDASQRGCKILPQVKQLQPPSASFLDFDNSAPPSPARLPLQSAVDLHNALAQHGRDRSRSNATNISAISTTDTSDDFSPNYGSFTRPSVLRSHDDVLRSRSGSNASGVLDVEMFHPNDSSDQFSSLGLTEDGGRTAVRPGILRGHQRTGSSGQSSSTTPSRALRFDSVSNGVNGERNRRAPSLTGSPASIPARLQPTPSSSSLRNRIEVISAQSASRDRSPSINSGRPQPSPQAFDEEDEEQDYGQQLPTSRLAPVIDEAGEELHPPSASLLRQRGMSFGSSSQTSLSPIFSGEHTNSDTIPPLSADIIPFSSTSMDNTDFPPDNQLSVPESDRRGRGDSLSSTSTADSANIPQYSTSGSTVGSGTSVAVLTPLIDGNLPLPSTGQVLEEEDRYEETVQDHEIKRQKDHYPLPPPPPIMVQTPSNYSTLNERRAHSPLDIDIGLISSHAQAEALVERTRQDILELASGQELSSGTTTSGPTPLSAKLAALGESLALERKLREQEKLGVTNKDGAGLPPPLSPLDSQFDTLTPVESANRNGVERQHSLEAKPRPTAKPRSTKSKRPSTADGLSSRSANNSFFTDQPRPTHHASLSASPPITSQTSTSFDRREFYTAPHQRSAVFGNGAIPNPKMYEPLTAPPLVTSRTRKDIDANSLSRVSSAEGVDTETESTVVPVDRVPTAGGTTPRKRDPIRNATSAKKLTRMGFTATDQTVVRPTEPAGKRFVKSIMATLKGKS